MVPAVTRRGRRSRRRSVAATRRPRATGGDAGVEAVGSGCGTCEAVGCDVRACELPGCDGCDGCSLPVLVTPQACADAHRRRLRHTAAVQPDEPAGPSPAKKRDDEEERKRRRAERREGIGEGVAEGVADTASSRRGRGSGCDCDACDACDLVLSVRLSSILLGAALVLPETGGRAMVQTFLRAYRRWFTRFTPECPSTPSCSAFATAAVALLGVRRGLAVTAARLRSCRSA